MDNEDFKIRVGIIEKTFNDPRKIKCLTPEKDRELPEHIYRGGDIFTTEEGEFIDLEFQIDDFNEYELAKYIELAEAMYEKHKKRISIYILCPNNVNICVREMEIPSESDFTIKLACIDENPAHTILNAIKSKMKRGTMLDRDDIEVLKTLPLICEKAERNYFRIECLKIMNRIV